MWLKAQYSDAVVIDLLKPDVFRTFQARPESLADVVKGNAQARRFVLDEIQKVPELLSVVHSLIEEHLGLQFILTGSSARKIRRTGADLLALGVDPGPRIGRCMQSLLSLVQEDLLANDRNELLDAAKSFLLEE